MKVSRAVTFWIVVIVALLLLEVAQLTHLFTLGLPAILGNTLSFVFALLLVTVLALVGAVFVGIFIAHRILSPQGFSPFEEEMMRMRHDVHELTAKVGELHAHLHPEEGKRTPSGTTDAPSDPPSTSPPAGGAR